MPSAAGTADVDDARRLGVAGAGAALRAGRAGRCGAVPASSATNGLGRLRSARTATRWRPRVIATCRTRRSSSSSSARRWGTIPSATPNTATRSHSRPLTRCTVDSVTPAGSVSRLNTARSHGSKPPGSGCRSATPSSPSMSSRWLRALPAARAVEQAHRRAEADVVAHRLEHVARRAGPAGVDDDAQVVDEAQHLRGVLVGDLVGEAGELGQAPARPAGEAVREPLRQAARRPAQDLDDVVGRHRVARRGDAQVGERGAHPGALEDVGAQHRRHRHAGLVERDVRREQQRVDARRARRSTSCSTPSSPSHPRTVVTSASAPSSRPWSTTRSPSGRRVAGRARVDLLGDAPMVVAEQRAGAVDDLDRAAVVDGQRVRHGAGEQPVVVDEERRVGAGVAVDALVVVADAEHVEGGQGEQPHEQHVGRREVLELVDEEVPARALDRAAERPVGEEHLDGGVDLLVEVDDAAPAEVVAERREQLGEARARRRVPPRRRRGR